MASRGENRRLIYISVLVRTGGPSVTFSDISIRCLSINCGDVLTGALHTRCPHGSRRRHPSRHQMSAVTLTEGMARNNVMWSGIWRHSVSYRIVSVLWAQYVGLYAHIYLQCRNIINDTITLWITSTSDFQEWRSQIIQNRPKLIQPCL